MLSASMNNVSCGGLTAASVKHYLLRAAGCYLLLLRHHYHHQESICTCSKLVGGDFKRLDLQSECVEGEGWYHSQNLLCVAHVRAAKRTSQVVETGVTG